MQDVMHLIKVQATSGRVYEAITTEDDIRQWWTRDAGNPTEGRLPRRVRVLWASGSSRKVIVQEAEPDHPR